MIKERQKVKPDLKAMFVVNRQKPNTGAIKEVRAALEQIGIPVLESGINDRVSFAKTLGNGVTVFEEKGKAASEIKALANELLKAINDE